MARNLFIGDVVLLPGAAGASPTLFSGRPFTLWSADVGGTQYTDFTARDGVSPVSLVTDANGLLPVFRGPDLVETVYVDTGAAQRFPLFACDELSYVLDRFRNTEAVAAAASSPTPGGGGTGVTDHGSLSGLANDDHLQYLTAARGDARYYSKTTADQNLSNALGSSSTQDRARANHTGTQAISTILNLEARLAALEAATATGSGSVDYVYFNTSTNTWPARTNVESVVWVGGTAAAPPPGNIGTDEWIRDAV